MVKDLSPLTGLESHHPLALLGSGLRRILSQEVMTIGAAQRSVWAILCREEQDIQTVKEAGS